MKNVIQTIGQTSDYTPNLFIPIIFFLLMTTNAYSQNEFIKHIGTEYDDTQSSCCIVNNNKVIIEFNSYELYFANPKSSIFLIDNFGKVTDSLIYNDPSFNYHIGNIGSYNDTIFMQGLTKHVDSSLYNIWICCYDTNLNLISEKLYKTEFINYSEFESNQITENLHAISINGFTNQNTQDIGIYMYNKYWELTKDTIYQTSTNEHITDISHSSNNDSFYLFGFGFSSYSPNQRLTIDFNLNINQIDTIPNDIRNSIDCEYLNDNCYVLGGKKIAYNDPNETNYLMIQKMTHEQEILNEAYFNHPQYTINHIGASNCVSKNDDAYLYLAGTSNMGVSTYANVYSWIMLNKLDSELNLIWQKYYGGDCNYLLYDVQSTPDGGCIMTGTRYDWNTQYNERDIFVMKVDENGLITSVNGEEFQVADAIVFPNPGTDILYIQSGFEVKEFRMMDINGRMVLQQPIHSLTEGIEVNQLPAGTYLYQIIGRDGEVQHGKWVKI